MFNPWTPELIAHLQEILRIRYLGARLHEIDDHVTVKQLRDLNTGELKDQWSIFIYEYVFGEYFYGSLMLVGAAARGKSELQMNELVDRNLDSLVRELRDYIREHIGEHIDWDLTTAQRS